MLTFSETTQLVKLRNLAKEKGRDDVLAKIDGLLQQGNPKDTMSREGRIYEEAAREEQSEYNTLKEQQAQIENLLDAARKAGKKDVVEKAVKIQSLINKEVYDFEDVTEEIRGAGSAALESLSGGILGDEAQAWAISGLTGADYDVILKDTRRVQQEFSEDHPAADLGIRIATGILPSAKLAKIAGVGSTFVGGALRQGGLATGEIGLYSFMEGEGGVEQRLENVAETFQDPLALGATALAGGLGGIAGRSVGKMQAVDRAVAEAPCPSILPQPPISQEP